MMQSYNTFKPTPFDNAGSFIDSEDRNWFVSPCGVNRDSDCLTVSNWEEQKKCMEKTGPEGTENDDGTLDGDWVIHRFGHWGPGWFEVLLVRPESPAAIEAQNIAESLENYPVLNEDDFSRREQEAAESTWKDCYNNKERLEYMRRHESQFEAHDLAELISCARGNCFLGYASELIN